MSGLKNERVLSVHHWTDTLFSFTTTRSPGFRFTSGQFTMIGLQIDGRPVLRAYSMASAHYTDTLEFFSIKVPNGTLTSRLQHLKEGDVITVGQKATGTLLLDSLLPAESLYLLATGTGVAPFASIVRDAETYERFDRIVLVQGCRRVADLAYGEMLVHELISNELIGDLAREKLIYCPTVTREPFRTCGRISDLVFSGELFESIAARPFSIDRDRVMLCGSPAMLRDLEEVLRGGAFREGNRSQPGHYVLERAFVER